MRSRPQDSFEEWLATPFASQSADPRFEVRRAELADFERIYDLVDDAFEVERPRAVYDWLYRKSPLGPVRTWIVVERATQAIVSVTARLPWPLARGGTPIEGALSADSATIPRFQRQGLRELRNPARKADPWRQRTALIAWPNEKTRERAAKRGHAAWSFGPLPRWVLPLRVSKHLQHRYGLPKLLAAAAGTAADFSLGLTRASARRGRRIHVEEVSAFDQSFDPVTWEGMAAPAFWSPHDAEFLNWRYGAHPAHEYVCLAASEGDDPCGYAVVRLAPTRAVLMELVSPRGPHVAHALIRRAAKTAREASCPQLDFEATPSWPHAPVLRRAGFMRASSDVYLSPYVPGFSRDTTSLEDWQLVPGDQDSL